VANGGLSVTKHLPEWADGDRARVAFDEIWGDLAELPLVKEHDVDRVVDTGHFVWGTITKPWVLSKAQEEVLRDLTLGMTPGQIAHRRGIKTRTVNTHIARARVRLRCKTTEQAIAVAIGSGVVHAIDRDPQLGDRVNVRSMSKRHKDTLALVAEGNTTDEIADLMGVSPETVKDRVEEVLQIMGARNRPHAVALAFSTGRMHVSNSRHTSEDFPKSTYDEAA
jgi:DNA-binding CsgD family transcriptional regulator